MEKLTFSFLGTYRNVFSRTFYSKEYRNILTAKHHKSNKSDNIFKKKQISNIYLNSNEYKRSKGSISSQGLLPFLLKYIQIRFNYRFLRC